MTQHLDSNFEALIYTTNRAIAIGCTDALAELPINWIMLDDARRVTQCASDRHFAFFILDIDSPQGAAILRNLSSAESSRSVVLVITEQPIDPDILEMCYKAQFFYPVRAGQIHEQLSCSMPLAERLTADLKPEPAAAGSEYAGEELPVILVEPYSEPQRSTALAFVATLAVSLGCLALRFFSDMFRNQHSLSAVWQERVASGISALGSIWLVQDLTQNFPGLQRLGPPPAGPLYLIALATLLWLCAKHRRVSERVQSLASFALA